MDSEYWNFTFYEMATQDIPQLIDYVCNKTGKPKVSYIGHSQGTIVFFTAASVFQE